MCSKRMFLCGFFINLLAVNVFGLPIIQWLPETLEWHENPKLHGLQTSILFGNPTLPESYVERIRIPANFKLQPHSHQDEGRRVTILSGTLYYAFGKTFNVSQLKMLPAGSFFTEPKATPHYAETREQEVILQLDAIGPTSTEYSSSE
ncbi:conserved hypothetical protein [Gammaproteobacteria bacterium]